MDLIQAENRLDGRITPQPNIEHDRKIVYNGCNVRATSYSTPTIRAIATISINPRDLILIWLIINETTVLLIDPKHYDWVPSENGIVEANAIDGGNTGKEKLHIYVQTYRIICRTYNIISRSREDYYPYAGMMKPSSHACFRGCSSKLKRNYRLLVYRKNSK
ncbi:hypothetical protein PV328_004177 [Microctonus aethiopoides]|uniref:Uncharacterized protein n=1 Tax=Microctonus aethiopoides TaxID=144406 RepID=A0AA39FA60_9HYME|nr:hypothetical protein PV328_004177 [Microctonus aethiopoides]